MSVIRILLTEQFTAVLFSVNLNNTAVCFIGKNKLCNTCYNTCVNNAAEQCEYKKDNSSPRQYIF